MAMCCGSVISLASSYFLTSAILMNRMSASRFLPSYLRVSTTSRKEDCFIEWML
jgi:hypothetical protein